MKIMLTVCGVFVWGALQAPAQYAGSVDSAAMNGATGRLTVRTDIDSALVFLDTSRVGLTPLVIEDVQPGIHRLKVVHPDVTNWLTGSIVDSIQIHAGEEKTFQYDFSRRYLILSVPSGADLMVDDSLYGTTPFLLTLSGNDSVRALTLREPGYEAGRVDLSGARRGIVTVALKRLPGAPLSEEVLEEEAPGANHGAWRLYAAGSITVGFGAAAAYFKIKADNRYDEYLSNSTGASRSQVQAYDTASAICLVVAEAGFCMLSYFLLAR
jgi:hypothetical protein